MLTQSLLYLTDQSLRNTGLAHLYNWESHDLPPKSHRASSYAPHYLNPPFSPAHPPGGLEIALGFTMAPVIRNLYMSPTNATTRPSEGFRTVDWRDMGCLCS